VTAFAHLQSYLFVPESFELGLLEGIVGILASFSSKESSWGVGFGRKAKSWAALTTEFEGW